MSHRSTDSPGGFKYVLGPLLVDVDVDVDVVVVVVVVLDLDPVLDQVTTGP
jgi:hypothetical protein